MNVCRSRAFGYNPPPRKSWNVPEPGRASALTEWHEAQGVVNSIGRSPWWACCALAAGCGTTKWSDSPRTATEQLLVSDAVDRAISEIDFSALANKNVYLDTRFIITALDQNYVISTLRQHMLASGCIIKDKPDEATYVVEVRTGSLGTNRQDLLFGVPATNLPTVGLLPMGSAPIPEIALMKRTNQQGVCKIAVFAYDRMSGRPVWQSGNRKIASRAKDSWVMGAGPFQKGTIYDGTAFAGEKFAVPLFKPKRTAVPLASVGEEKSVRSSEAASRAITHARRSCGKRGLPGRGSCRGAAATRGRAGRRARRDPRGRATAAAPQRLLRPQRRPRVRPRPRTLRPCRRLPLRCHRRRRRSRRVRRATYRRPRCCRP